MEVESSDMAKPILWTCWNQFSEPSLPSVRDLRERGKVQTVHLKSAAKH